jgi:aspartokinase/homoserine dehydrogenase 1
MSIQSKWTVHKFGGTSVANADRYKNVSKILETEPKTNKGVVVSAMSGVTNSLIKLVELAKSRDNSYLTKLEELQDKHIQAVNELFIKNPNDLKAIIIADFEEIKEVLRGVWLLKEFSERTVELVSGFGEIWSAQLLNALLLSQGKKSTWLDARKVLIVKSKANSVKVQWTKSIELLDAWLLENNDNEYTVITGFVASTEDGVSTTLKRNGSDLSGSIFGSLLNADKIIIWTDVDGVLSADPRLVPDAILLDDLSYTEATELAYFGAKVVHPDTMAPAIGKKIPIYIKNSFNPTVPGTKIHTLSSNKHKVKGISSIEDMVLLNIEGTGMMGVPGVANKVFGALKEVDVSVVMISQASSEHSICLVVPQAHGDLAKETLTKAFFAELHDGVIQTIEVSTLCSVLAVVGDHMANHPGIAGQLFTALGRAGVNIKAIAQGSSERNISFVVDKNQSKLALRAAHSSLFISPNVVSVGIIGSGLIGKTLIKQLKEELSRLKSENIIIKVTGITNSKKMITSESAIDLDSWEGGLLSSYSKDLDLTVFANHINSPLSHSVIIDCTSSEEVAKNYPAWLAQGLHVITPNKKSNSGKLELYQEIKDARTQSNKFFLYETTVGAGLPVISTLKEIIATGDKVLEIEGVLSGTLSYIFNNLKVNQSFASIIKDAKTLGYTEPDPRDDLSGVDVARKLVILAREIGMKVELKDVTIESLVPPELMEATSEEFMEKLVKFDSSMNARLQQAEKNNEVLKFVGSISEAGNLSVSLKAFPKDHALSKLSGSDNFISIRTRRYNKNPLIIQGPGAGAEVTAAGVFGDLIKLCTYLGGSQ